MSSSVRYALLVVLMVAVKSQAINEAKLAIGDNMDITCHFKLDSGAVYWRMQFNSSSASIVCDISDMPLNTSSLCQTELISNGQINGSCDKVGGIYQVNLTCNVTELFIGTVCCWVKVDKDCQTFPLPTTLPMLTASPATNTTPTAQGEMGVQGHGGGDDVKQSSAEDQVNDDMPEIHIQGGPPNPKLPRGGDDDEKSSGEDRDGVEDFSREVIQTDGYDVTEQSDKEEFASKQVLIRDALSVTHGLRDRKVPVRAKGGDSSIEGLKMRFGISDAQLDVEIMSADIFEISRFFRGNLKRYFLEFKLSNAEQSDIMEIERQRGSQAAILVALNMWISHNPALANYRELVNILLSLRDDYAAERLCTYIVDEYG